MSLLESFRLALSNIAGNKLRSFLTLLGVVIGIASVIAILTLGKALRASTMDSLSGLGATDYAVRVQEKPTEDDVEMAGGEDFYYADPTDEYAFITEEMVQDVRKKFGSQIDGVTVGDNDVISVNFGSSVSDTSAMGQLYFVNTDFFHTRDIKLEEGRVFTEKEIDSHAAVAIISPQLVGNLFKGDTHKAIGSELTFDMGDTFGSFTIIGVKKDSNQGVLGNLFGPSMDVYVPYSQKDQVSYVSGAWEAISVRKAADVDAVSFENSLRDFFDRLYANDEQNEVVIRDLSKDLESFNKVISTISAVIAAIASISLFVGGIGVMNIMLITVTERTREIGVRKALGATRKDIRRQFVIEAMVVCLIGGVIGLVLGASCGIIGAVLMGTFVFPSLSGILISLVFCLMIGIFFGWYPANRAAKLDPIEALRHE